MSDSPVLEPSKLLAVTTSGDRKKPHKHRVRMTEGLTHCKLPHEMIAVETHISLGISGKAKPFIMP